MHTGYYISKHTHFSKIIRIASTKYKYRFKWTSNSILTQDRSSNHSNFKSVLLRTNVSNKTNNGLLGDNLTPHDLLEYRLWLDGMWKDNLAKNSFRKENHSCDWPNRERNVVGMWAAISRGGALRDETKIAARETRPLVTALQVFCL